MAQIQLDIVTAERLVVSEPVDYVSAPGIDGVLGILPRHAPLLTALTPGELRYRRGNEEFAFAIGGGFMEVRPDRVTVLADSAERAEDIDEMRAEQARKRAEESLKERPQHDLEFQRIEQSLRRAEVRLKVARQKRGARRPIDPGVR